MSALLVIARGLVLTGAMLAIGSVMLRVSFTQAGIERTALARRVDVVAWCIAVLGAGTWFVAQLMQMQMGYSLQTVRDIALETAWGQSWVIATLVCIAGAWSAARNAPIRVQLGVSIALAASLGGLGHAAADQQWPIVARAADAIHVFGAGTWVGTLVLVWYFQRFVQPREASKLWSVFSKRAVFAAIAMILAGTTSAWLRLDAPQSLFTSNYGRILLNKTILALVIVGIGALNRRRVVAGGTPRAALVRTELVLIALVVMATTVLTGTPLPGE